MTQDTELQHYKELIKQYRELLDICYWYIHGSTPGLGEDKFSKFNLLSKLESIGIGDTEPRPQIKEE